MRNLNGSCILDLKLCDGVDSFTEPEQKAMMESYRNASKNTMFEEWLDATKRPQVADEKAEDDSPKAGDQTADRPELVDVMQYLAEGKVGNADLSQLRWISLLWLLI